MLVRERDKRVCERFSKRDIYGLVHCSECPLVRGNPDGYDFRCKANSHYDPKTHTFEYDEVNNE